MSDPSSTITIYACGLPKNQNAPMYVTSTQASITIEWDSTGYDGGCPIYDYGIYRDDDGSGTTYTEVNPVGSYVRNDPFNRNFIVTMFPGTATIGDYFYFKIRAFNL